MQKELRGANRVKPGLIAHRSVIARQAYISRATDGRGASLSKQMTIIFGRNRYVGASLVVLGMPQRSNKLNRLLRTANFNLA